MEVSKRINIIQNNSSLKSEREGFIFISYKREESLFAERLRLFLEKAGYSVWWDKQIQCGQAWNQVLDDAVKQAGCIVVLWSPLSRESKWVAHEASVGLARNNYTPVRIHLCSIPSPYDQTQATDVFDWDGISDHPGVRDLINRCDGLLPERRTALSRIKRTLWINRMAVLSLMFGLIALIILAWQTLASRSQLKQLNSIISQQKESSIGLDTFRQQSSRSVQSQLQRLDSVFAQQQKASENLDLFRKQSESSLQSQLQRLDKVFDQQLKSTDNLNDFRSHSDKSLNDFSKRSELNTMRGYYHLEPLTIEFTLEYPFTDKNFSAYINRLQQANKLPKKGSGYMINLMNPELEEFLPKKGSDERYAIEELLSDETSFTFTDVKQVKDPNSKSFVQENEQDRGIIRFSSYPQYLADVIVKLPSTNKIEQKIELWADDGKFIKKVRCSNPVRTGDDNYAFSVIDLIGRVMRYKTIGNATLKEFRFKFSYDYDSYDYLGHTITFPQSTSEMIITPQHLGLQKYEIKESVRLAREQFELLPKIEKIKLLNTELKIRVDFFIKTFVQMEKDRTWSLAEWAKIEWTANALDGNPPFQEDKNNNPRFEDRSFKWLLLELYNITVGNDKKKLEVAIKGADKLFVLLTSAKPDSDPDKIIEITKTVRQEIFKDFGLEPWKSNTDF